MDVVIDMTDEERKLAEKYAEMHGSSLEELFKSALFERIEVEEATSIKEARAEKSLRKTALANPDLPVDFIKDILAAKEMPTEPFNFDNDEATTRNPKATLEDLFEGYDGQYTFEEISLKPIGKEYQPSDAGEPKGD